MNNLKDIFTNFTSLPYLFIGSGISRRYLNLDDWEGLLKRFIGLINDDDLAFQHYKNSAKTKLKEMNEEDESLLLPMVASLLEDDFNNKWFTDSKFLQNRNKHKDKAKAGMSPLKIEICDYIMNNSSLDKIKEASKQEIEFLQEIADKSINGIITTNYDLLIQNLFESKDYDTYVGQKNLMFASTDGIREIYKIHGCCNDPSSIMITCEDYLKFRKKNAYIAAKLLTIFVEHPIIFIGYNIGDNNIINILESIVDCLDENDVDQLKNRLFFVQRSKREGHLKVIDYVHQFGKVSIPMKKIEINDFSILYKTILKTKAKYNPRLLKMLKKDIYNLVITNEATGTLIATANIDDKDLDKVDVVIGVGLKNLAKNGIVGISTIDIFEDIILDKFDWLTIPEFKNDFISKTLSQQLARSSYSLPVFKYINDVEELPYSIQKYADEKLDLDSFLSESLKNEKTWVGSPMSITEVISRYNDIDNQMLKMAILNEDQINLDDLKKYLLDVIKENEDIFNSKHSTNIRRLIKIYDFLKYKK